MSRLFTNGTTNKVTVSPAASINNLAARTYMAWIKVASWPVGFQDFSWYARGAATFADIVDGISFGGLSYYAGLDAATDAYSEDDTSADAFVAGVWGHVAVTFDNAGDKKLRIFHNGIQIAVYGAQTAAAGALADDSAVNLLIGAFPGTNFSTVNGRMYDFRLYNSVLTPTELAAIIAGGITTDPQPTHNKCQLTFATNQTATEPDVSGNSNIGAITGATFSSDNPTFVPTKDTIAVGEYGGHSLAEAFFNPHAMDLIQVVNEGGKVVWKLSSSGVESVNPVTSTQTALLGRYEGASFALAFPNPYSKDVFQIIGQGDKIVFWVDSTGAAHTA